MYIVINVFKVVAVVDANSIFKLNAILTLEISHDFIGSDKKIIRHLDGSRNRHFQ